MGTMGKDPLEELPDRFRNDVVVTIESDLPLLG